MGGNVFDQSTFDRQKLAAGGGPQTDFLGDVNSILAPMYINLLRSRVGFPKAAVSPPWAKSYRKCAARPDFSRGDDVTEGCRKMVQHPSNRPN